MQNATRVPLSTYLMLLGLMVAFLGVSFDVVFFAPWAWWVIPVVGVIAFAIGASMKSAERRRRREQIEELDREYTR